MTASSPSPGVRWPWTEPWFRGLRALVLGVALGMAGQGAAPVWVHLGTREGLPSSVVVSLMEDRDGFLWVGTLQGPVRIAAEGAEAVLPPGPYLQREVRRLFQGQDGTVWVVHRQGPLMACEGPRGRLVGAAEGFPEQGLVAVAEDAGGRLLVATRDALFRREGKGFVALASPEGWARKERVAMAATADGIWVGERGGRLAHWDGARWQEEARVHPEGILDLVRGPDGRLWLLTREGLWVREGRDWKATALVGRPFHGVIGGFSEVRTPLVMETLGRIWTLDGQGAARSVAALPGGTGGAALYDRRRRLWVGTLNGAMVRSPGELQRLEPNPGGSPLATRGGVLLRTEGSRVLVGTQGGLLIAEPEGRWVWRPYPSPQLWTLALAPDGQGGLWIGTQEGLLRLRGQRVESVPFAAGRVIVSLLPFQGRLVVATSQGLVFLGDQGEVVMEIRPTATGAPLHHLGLWKGQLLVAGSGGLLRLEGAALVPAFPGAPFEGAQVHTFQVGPDGELWVATTRGVHRSRDGGWTEVDPHWPGQEGNVTALAFLDGHPVFGHAKGASWVRPAGTVRLGAGQGLEGEGVLEEGLLVDGQGRLWLGTGHGLFRVDAPDHLGADDVPAPEIEPGQPLVVPPGGPRTLTFRVHTPYPLPPFPPLVSYRVEGLDRVEHPLGNRRELVLAGMAPGRYVLHVKAGFGAGPGREGVPLTTRVRPAFHEYPALRFGFLGLLAGALTLAWRRHALTRLERSNQRLTLEVARQTASLSRRHADLEEAHGQVKEALEARMRQTRGVVHDLRGPLAAISLVAQRLEGNPGVPERFQEVLQGETGRLEALLRQLLDEARSQHVLPGLHLRPMSPDEVFAGFLEGLQVRAEAKGLAFRFQQDTGTESVAVEGDPLALQQVLLNLVGNALKFTDAGAVVVYSGVAEGHWCLEVRDTGRGMDPEAQARLFQPFVQAQASDGAEGWGLGLSIVQGIVEAHRGRLTVDSQSGQGSVFRVQIPLRGGNPGKAGPSAAP